jgi:rare lipoprotein A
VIAGRSYYPNERPQGYAVVGMASWYGDAFHGRRTANGEVFDRNSISAAHPTLPLPSYVRVTNLGNGHSMIVRVNDRGPYHGGRVMDVSQRVAETLDFKRAGTAKIRVEYVGRADLAGSDDEKLLATLRTDGGPAQMAGVTDAETTVAAVASVPVAPRAPAPAPQSSRVARVNRSDDEPAVTGAARPVLEPVGRLMHTPLPPVRPFETTNAERTAPLPPTGHGKHTDRHLAAPRGTPQGLTLSGWISSAPAFPPCASRSPRSGRS